MEDIIFYSNIVEKGIKDNKKFVVLKDTLFYPDGKGGQLGDRGYIQDRKVFYVLEENKKILHFLEDFPEEKTEVKAIISGERREDISIQHTAQHILSRIILDSFDKETLSFHMGEDYSTIDIERLELSNREIDEIEDKANKIVKDGRIVKFYYIDKDSLNEFNLRKYADIDENIRIVEIENFDKTMCGGTHIDNTLKIRLIKIIKVEKIKGDLIRIYFLAGNRAIKDYSKKLSILNNIKNRFFLAEEDIENFIIKIINEREDGYKKLKKIKEILINYEISENREKEFVIKYINYLDDKDLLNLSKNLILKNVKFVYLYNDTFGVITKQDSFELNLSELLEELKEKFSVKGGGKDFLSIKFQNNKKSIEELIWKKIKSQ